MSQAKISLPVELVNSILGYLGKRPYEETYQLINAVQTQAVMAQAAAEQPQEEPKEE